MGTDIKLYDLCGANPELRFSAPCWKAKLALAHKGLAFETIPVPFTGIAAIGGGDLTRTVPVLDDNGRMIRDSFAIALHLEETCPPHPLFAAGGVAIARFVEGTTGAASSFVMRMIAKDIHDQLAPADQDHFRLARERRYGMPLADIQQGVEPLTADLSRAFQPVRKALDHGDYLGGDRPLFVDYVAVAPLIWLYVIAGQVPLPADDPVRVWFERIGALYGGMVANTTTVGPA